MTVHMFRVLAASESTDTVGLTLSEVNAALDDWMSKQSEWEADPAEHTATEAEPLGGGTAHYSGSYRLTFDSEPKENILQKLGDKLKNKVDWYRVGYHECSHDADNPSPCSWGDGREWTSTNTGGIPDDIPNFV